MKKILSINLFFLLGVIRLLGIDEQASEILQSGVYIFSEHTEYPPTEDNLDPDDDPRYNTIYAFRVRLEYQKDHTFTIEPIDHVSTCFFTAKGFVDRLGEIHFGFIHHDLEENDTIWSALYHGSFRKNGIIQGSFFYTETGAAPDSQTSKGAWCLVYLGKGIENTQPIESGQ